MVSLLRSKLLDESPSGGRETKPMATSTDMALEKAQEIESSRAFCFLSAAHRHVAFFAQARSLESREDF